MAQKLSQNFLLANHIFWNIISIFVLLDQILHMCYNYSLNGEHDASSIFNK
jgi:hypothetical protein